MIRSFRLEARADHRPGAGSQLAQQLAVLATTMSLAACTASAGQPPAAVPSDLFDKASARGSVRVIVQLRVPEGADAAAIEAVKQALLAEIAGTQHQVSRALDPLPALALEASADTLRMLSASRHVERVTEDRLSRPKR